MLRNFTRVAFGLCLATVLAGCGLSQSAAGSNGVQPPAATSQTKFAGQLSAPGKIQHVIVIVQEARSFDNLFCTYPGSDASTCSAPSIPLEAKCTLSDTFADYERDRKTGDFSHEKTDCPGY